MPEDSQAAQDSPEWGTRWNNDTRVDKFRKTEQNPAYDRHRIASRIRRAIDGDCPVRCGEGGFLQAAACHTRANEGPIREKQRVAREDAQQLALIEWAARNGKLILTSRFATREPDNGGVEHDVFTGDLPGRVVKVTRDKPVFVWEYLQRMMLQNAIFGDAVELEGLTFHLSGRLALVTSQPFRSGSVPAQKEIDTHMRRLGFHVATLPLGFYTGYEITIADAEPKNWIKDHATGFLMPIDVQISPIAQVNPFSSI